MCRGKCKNDVLTSISLHLRLRHSAICRCLISSHHIYANNGQHLHRITRSQTLQPNQTHTIRSKPKADPSVFEGFFH
ncbi:hypothetical protein L6452_40449 [Arctium lappa]|uniref:Uncharacterized protein n=1 Tax=Arctium lappa TaxID=4217 RepID=A0ACB8XMI1_ARCLA|nr:hypothetical protein L6452_40449 [Arctium lappa]